MAIVEEEADETLFWLELLSEMEIIHHDHLVPLMQENNALISIVVASIKTCKRNIAQGKGERFALKKPQSEFPNPQ